MKNNIILLSVLMLLFTGCSSSDNSKNQTQQQNNNSQSAQNNRGGDSGFNLDTLADALKNAGYISEPGEELDGSKIDAEKLVSYGNLIIGYFNLSSQSYFDIYNNAEAIIDGKTVKVGGAVGPYILFFVDGNIDQEAVYTFEEAGGYYRR